MQWQKHRLRDCHVRKRMPYVNCYSEEVACGRTIKKIEATGFANLRVDIESLTQLLWYLG
jgi:hypothetical protein